MRLGLIIPLIGLNGLAVFHWWQGETHIQEVGTILILSVAYVSATSGRIFKETNP